MSPRILIVEDETILAEAMSIYLERLGYAVALAPSGPEGLCLAGETRPDIALVDIRLPGLDGLEVLRRLHELSPTTRVVMITAYASIASAVEAIKSGAFDYLTKPLDLEEMREVVDSALADSSAHRRLSSLQGPDGAEDPTFPLIGESPAMRTLREQIDRIAALESPDGSGGPTILILGETGVGKQLVARAIHDRSPTAKGPFVEINCAAIPTTLLEAELFGYERGAYTDARNGKAGLFEAAEGGTLFLDEIGHTDLSLQAKLLKAVEDKAVRRLGGLHMKPINVRIIAATNRDLAAAVAEGSFRADLYYRIEVLCLKVPPLRTRGADITLLARHFLERVSQQYALRPKTLTPEAESFLLTYPWPGNVRELDHVMARAVLIHNGDVVDPDALGLPGTKAGVPMALGSRRSALVDFPAEGIVLDEVERQLIEAALHAACWNRTQAARLLGISTETLRYRMEKYELRRPS